MTENVPLTFYPNILGKQTGIKRIREREREREAVQWGLDERDDLNEVFEEDTIDIAATWSWSEWGVSRREVSWGRVDVVVVVVTWKPWLWVSEIRIVLQIHQTLRLKHSLVFFVICLWIRRPTTQRRLNSEIQFFFSFTLNFLKK